MTETHAIQRTMLTTRFQKDQTTTAFLSRLAALFSALMLALLPVSTGFSQTPAIPAQDEVENALEETDADTVELDRVRVTGSRLRPIDIEGPSPVMTFDREYIDRSGFPTLEQFIRNLPMNFSGAGAGRQAVPNDENPAFGIRQPAQSGAGLRGLGTNATLVLINGRRYSESGIGNTGTPTQQSFVDLNTIPLGMIERIEVLADGASAIYGSDAVAGVINIVLKRDYVGSELLVSLGGTHRGGASERRYGLTTGFVQGRLQGFLNVDYYDRKALFASDREFSAGGGLSPIGYPLRITSLGGVPLEGVFNPNGTPANAALVPPGQDGTTLTRDDFNATAGQTSPYATADLYSLITPTERYGASTRLVFDAHSDLDIIAEFSATRTRGSMLANPPVTSAPTGFRGTIIPAENPFNPFNQDLGMVMVHLELGSREFSPKTVNYRAFLGLEGRIDGRWDWEVGLLHNIQRLTLDAQPNVDNQRLVEILRNTDPAQTLNLFADVRAVGPVNDPALYRSIINEREDYSTVKLTTFDATISGDIFDLPGGPVTVLVGFEHRNQDRLRTTDIPSIILDEVSKQSRDNTAIFAEAMVPIIGAENRTPGFYGLSFHPAGRYERDNRGSSTTDPKLALRYLPVRSLLLRGSYSTSFRAPALSELERPEQQRVANVFDPARGENYPMELITGSFPDLEPETSETWNFGFVFSPDFLQGFSIGASYNRIEQENLTGNFNQNLVLQNESLFPDRVIREPQTPEDIEQGLPGRVQTLDIRFANFGLTITENIDVNMSYLLPWQDYGRWRLNAFGTYVKSYRIALNPGDPLEDRRGSFGFPQKYKAIGSLFYDYEDFGASLFVNFQGSLMRPTERVSSWTTVDVSMSYRFTDWMRVSLAVQNFLDRDPPPATTTWNYDGGFHSPRGRTYNLTVRTEF
ncbi:MAG: TonB-dependent receptor [Puniceicoccaceae bacterium]|nr:MAG: TonB-dependent receptor [Puniceicoccaceae bacterium]